MSSVHLVKIGAMPKMTTKAEPPPAITAPFHLRLPPKLKDVITKGAFEAQRSINAQIIYMLQVALSKEESHPRRTVDKTPIWKMEGLEEVVLQIFRELPPDKQLALIQLLRKE